MLSPKLDINFGRAPCPDNTEHKGGAHDTFNEIATKASEICSTRVVYSGSNSGTLIFEYDPVVQTNLKQTTFSGLSAVNLGEAHKWAEGKCGRLHLYLVATSTNEHVWDYESDFHEEFGRVLHVIKELIRLEFKAKV